MATFELEKNGKTYEVEAPDQAAALAALPQIESGATAKAKEGPGALERLGQGFMDPIYGAAQLGAEMGPEIGDIYSTPEDQRALQANVNKTVRDREQAYEAKRGPNAGFDWLRLGGSIPSAAVLTGPAAALGGIPGAVVAGGESGLIQPAAGENPQAEKAVSGVVGGTVGGVLGVAGKALGAGARAFGAYLAREYPENVMTQAVQTILKRMGQDEASGGPKAQDALDLINAASAQGKPMTLADVGGKNIERLAGNVYRQGGEGAAVADRFLQARDEGAAQRLSGDINRYVRGGPTMHQATEVLLTARSAAARGPYDQMRALENIWSPRLQQFIDEPVIRRGMARGYEIERLQALAENRPFDPHSLGVDLDQEGNIVFRQAPNMRVLDMGKQGLDAMIGDERNEITGRLTSRGVALERVRQAYLNELDTLDRGGIYRAARATWAGPSASLDALRAGRGIFQNSPEQIAADFGRLSPGDQEFYRIGVADMLRERLAKTGLSGDEAKAIIKNPWVRDQLRPIFRSPADFDSFVNAVTSESRMFEKNVNIRRGSQTAERIAEDESGENLMAAGGAKIAENIASGSWLSAAKNAVRMWRDLGIRPNPKLNEQISKILFQTPIDPQSEVAQRLTGKFPAASLTNRLEPAAGALEQSGAALAPGAASGLSQGSGSPLSQ